MRFVLQSLRKEQCNTWPRTRCCPRSIPPIFHSRIYSRWVYYLKWGYCQCYSQYCRLDCCFYKFASICQPFSTNVGLSVLILPTVFWSVNTLLRVVGFRVKAATGYVDFNLPWLAMAWCSFGRRWSPWTSSTWCCYNFRLKYRGQTISPLHWFGFTNWSSGWCTARALQSEIRKWVWTSRFICEPLKIAKTFRALKSSSRLIAFSTLSHRWKILVVWTVTRSFWERDRGCILEITAELVWRGERNP